MCFPSNLIHKTSETKIKNMLESEFPISSFLQTIHVNQRLSKLKNSGIYANTKALAEEIDCRDT